MQTSHQKSARRISSQRSSTQLNDGSPSLAGQIVPKRRSSGSMKTSLPPLKKQRLSSFVSKVFFEDEPGKVDVEEMENPTAEKAVVVSVNGQKEVRSGIAQEGGDYDYEAQCSEGCEGMKWYKMDFNPEKKQTLELIGCPSCQLMGEKARVTRRYVEPEEERPLEEDSDLKTIQDFMFYMKDVWEQNFGTSDAPIQFQCDSSAVEICAKVAVEPESGLEKIFGNVIPTLPFGTEYDTQEEE